MRLSNPYSNPNQTKVRNDTRGLKFNNDKPKVTFDDPLNERYFS